MTALREALLFLISTLFDMYLFLLVIRVLLAYAGANYFDPITQFIVRCTDFAVKPLRRLIPNMHGIEVSSLILILALEFIKYLLIASLNLDALSIPGLFIMGFADMLKIILQTMFYAIILQAILSWVQPGSPINNLLYKINAPIMRPVQRLCPVVGGMDISPIPAMIIIQLLIILVVNPIMALGLGVTFG
jgi:YggT family protein